MLVPNFFIPSHTSFLARHSRICGFRVCGACEDFGFPISRISACKKYLFVLALSSPLWSVSGNLWDLNFEEFVSKFHNKYHIVLHSLFQCMRCCPWSSISLSTHTPVALIDWSSHPLYLLVTNACMNVRSTSFVCLVLYLKNSTSLIHLFPRYLNKCSHLYPSLSHLFITPLSRWATWCNQEWSFWRKEQILPRVSW